MKTKIREIDFQPFVTFGKALDELFAGYAVRKPWVLALRENKEVVDENLYTIGYARIMGESGEIVSLNAVSYAISRDRFLYLKKGETWIEIYLSDEKGMITLRLRCVGKVERNHCPEPLPDIHEFTIHTFKLENSGVIQKLKDFLDSKFADEAELKKWFTTENLVPFIQG